MYAYTASIISLFVCTYCAHTYTHTAVDPVPCGEISRAAFIGMNWLKYVVTCGCTCTVPYTLKFFQGLSISWFCQILVKNKFSQSSFQPHLASVMNLKFSGRNFRGRILTREIREKFSTSKILGYTVL